jgi:hypothetical protein
VLKSNWHADAEPTSKIAQTAQVVQHAIILGSVRELLCWMSCVECPVLEGMSDFVDELATQWRESTRTMAHEG